MRRKLIKTALTLVAVLALVLSVTAAASAAGQNAYAIRLDGKELPVNAILGEDDGRLYAPCKELFQAFGATANVDPDYGTVTAVRGSLTVDFTVDEFYMTVTEGKNSQSVFIDALPYEDDSGVIYVPVRYAAQAFGYVVDWDGAANAVVLQSIDSLIAESGATYAVMDRYLAAQKAFHAQAHALQSSFKLSLTLASDSDSILKPIPLNASGTVTGIVKQGDSDLQLKLTSNASEFAASMNSDGDELDAQTLFILSLLDNLSLRLITNSQTGMSYIQSPLSATIAGAKSDIWVSVNQGEQPSGLNIGALSKQMLLASSFQQYLSIALRNTNMSQGGGASVIRESLLTINSMLSDKSFVKDGDNYVSTFNSGMGGGNMQMKAVLKLTIKFAGTTYNGMSLDVALDMGGSGNATLRSNTDRTNSGTVELSLDIPSTLTLSLTAALAYAETSSEPAAEPPAGSTVLPTDGLFSSMLPGF